MYYFDNKINISFITVSVLAAFAIAYANVFRSTEKQNINFTRINLQNWAWFLQSWMFSIWFIRFAELSEGSSLKYKYYDIVFCLQTGHLHTQF